MTERTITDRQREVCELYAALNSSSAVARQLGIARQSVDGMLQRAGVKRQQASALLEVPDGQVVRGISTLVDSSGAVVNQWIKTDADRQARLEAFEAAVRGILKPIAKARPRSAPGSHDDDLMVVIPIGDPHIGMLAHADECGEDWNLERAVEVFAAAIDRAVSVSPRASKCLLINLGDFFHADDSQARTRRSGHHLDVSARWSHVLPAGIRLMRHMVDACLTRFRQVIVDNVAGNHDDHSAVMLRHVMQARYEREPRVTVDLSPSQHHYHRHGDCYIGTHHGSSSRFADLPLLMAASQSEQWGATKFRRIYCGHVHHDSVREFPGVTVETVNTLAPRDAYAAGAGYMSGRDLKVDVWHAKRGLINRSVIGIGELDNATK